jgi:hypothetical protein
MLYNQLIDTIEHTHNSLRKRATSSINQQLVIRNRLIGFLSNLSADVVAISYNIGKY